MDDWAVTPVASVPIRVAGHDLTVTLAVGVAPADEHHRHAGAAHVAGDFVVYAGPPCPFTISYTVDQTGQGGQARRGRACPPFGSVAFGIAPPDTREGAHVRDGDR